MGNELIIATAEAVPASGTAETLPALVERAGGAARFAWDEFFYAEHHNPHTQRAYLRAVRRFLAWAQGRGVELAGVTPGMIGQYLTGRGGSAARWNQDLAALRGFFDLLVQRHVCVLNPAASVRGRKETVVEGKTPYISVEQVRTLLESVETGHVIGLRDRAILMMMACTGCRAGAVARLRVQDFEFDGEQYMLRLAEKGGKSRSIPVRLELQRAMLAYLAAAGLSGAAKETPVFQTSNGRTRRLSGRALATEQICDLVKRRVKAAGLPGRLSPHSFRVKTATDLLLANVPLEHVQHLLGHAEPRTTALYDRRKKEVTRNLVERIPI